MALSDMQTAIADELSRSDLSAEITREINNAITFYQNERFWFNENTMITLTTIAGQRDYVLPPNFAAVTTLRSKLGNIEYLVNPTTIQYLDKINWTSTFQSSYIELYAFWNQMVRLYPAPTAGLPIYIRGTVLLPSLTTTAATKNYAFATSFNVNDTIQDPNGNIQTCVTAGTTQTAPTNTYAANTAFSLNNTVQDGNGNIQTCSTAGTTGYTLAADKTQWGRIVGSLTTDGTAVWNLTTLTWSTDYDSYTVDGSVVWHLTSNLSNAWMVNAEELIRTRATRMVYQRYIKDMVQAQSYQAMERDCVMNLRRKNIGQSSMGVLTPHL
jgi:hypothetical protein